MALVAWYKLNGNVLDSSINKNALTVSNTTYSTNSVIGANSLDFNVTGAGTTNITYDKFYPTFTNSTVCGWFYFDETEVINVTSNAAFTDTKINATCALLGYNNYGGISLYTTCNVANKSNGIVGLGVVVRSNEALKTISGGNLVYNKWNHYAYTVNNLTISLYINGEFIDSVVIPENNTWPIYGDRLFSICRDMVYGGNGPRIKMPAKVCDVRFYDEALSLKEIKELAKAKVLHYDFNHNTTDDLIVYDKSGWNNNGIIAEATSPTYINESIVNNGCYEFDGIDDFIQVPVLNINNNNKFTISFWCYCTDTGVRDIFFGNYSLSNNFNIERTTSNTLRFWYTTGSVDITIPAFTLPSLEWIHITIVYSSTGFKAYKNGVLIYENQTLTLTANVFSNVQYIGRDTRTGTTAFKGKIADFRIYSTALSEDDIKEIYQTRASIDENGNLYCNNIEENKYINPIVDYTSWVVGTSGAQTGFSLCGSITENYIIEGTDPFNNIIPIWEARPDEISGPDGGWVTSSFNIDNTKLYRFSVWVKRTVIGNGSFYLGVNGYGSVNGVYTLANVNNTNPYFYYSSGLFTNRQDQWLLVVGYVYPYTYTGTTSPADAGIYNVDGTKIVASTTSFKWRPETTTAKHRSYLYYSTNIDTRQQWCYPRVDVCDGTEPTIADLLNGIDYKHYQITKNLIASKGINKNSSILSNEFSEVGITEGLVAYYPLNGDAKDYSGNNNHGTVYGATMATGINNKKCYSFDGTNDYILINDGLLYGLSEFTIHAYYKRSGTSINECILCSRSNAVGEGVSIFLLTNGNIRLDTGIYYHWVTDKNIASNEEIIIDFIWTPSIKKLYINGTLYSSTTTTPTSISNLSQTVTTIGASQVDGSGLGNYLGGKIQDVRIYNRALSDKEIGILYNTFNPNINKTLQINKENIIYTKGNIKEV